MEKRAQEKLEQEFLLQQVGLNLLVTFSLFVHLPRPPLVVASPETYKQKKNISLFQQYGIST